jgi:AmmeMemoRadiSam system protein A
MALTNQARNDAQALLKIEPEVLEDGAECGLRSILFLLGVLTKTEHKTNVLSYEGPFGVGYMVATYTPVLAITSLARQSIEHYLQTGKLMPTPPNLPPELNSRAGVFVSLHEPNGNLRGCIGTTAPTTPSLASEIIANAISAATRDNRFDPVSATELKHLSISVDVLGPAVSEPDLSKLDPRKFGIIVSASDGRTGVLLPDLDNITTVNEQIAVCRQKGSIGPNDPIEIRKFQVSRYNENLELSTEPPAPAYASFASD